MALVLNMPLVCRHDLNVDIIRARRYTHIIFGKLIVSISLLLPVPTMNVNGKLLQRFTKSVLILNICNTLVGPHCACADTQLVIAYRFLFNLTPITL